MANPTSSSPITQPNSWNRPILQPNSYTTSVYYVHHSDVGTSQLVFVKFNRTGYSNWKQSIMLSLSAKNKLGFFDGTVTRPVVTLVD